MILLMICNLSLLWAKGQSSFYPVTLPNLSSAQFGPLVTDPFTAAYNPATLPDLSSYAVGIYTENRFLAKELKLLSLCAAFKQNRNGWSVLFQHFGNKDYNENRIGINYGMLLGNIRLGTLINYQLINITGNAPSYCISWGISSVWKITPQLFTSFRFTNPRLFLPKNKDRWTAAPVSNMGIGFQSSQNFYSGFELEKEEGRSPQVILVLRYVFEDTWFIKGCWSTGNHQPYFSCGWKWKDVKVEVGAGFHQVLGVSPSLSLIFQKNNTGDDQ